MRRAFCLCAAVVLLTACGQTGDLVLPDPKPQPPPAAGQADTVDEAERKPVTPPPAPEPAPEIIPATPTPVSP